MQMIGAGSSRATNVDHSKEGECTAFSCCALSQYADWCMTRAVQRWKAKYEALKSRLPQMFDLVMESDECESPTRDHVAAAPHHSPAKVNDKSDCSSILVSLSSLVIFLHRTCAESQKSQLTQSEWLVIDCCVSSGGCTLSTISCRPRVWPCRAAGLHVPSS